MTTLRLGAIATALVAFAAFVMPVALPSSAEAQTVSVSTASTVPLASRENTPVPWALAPNRAYGFVSNGNLFVYPMGTNNARNLLKGARKVPKNTLFFLGANGQLYMRSGRFLEKNGDFMFGPE